MELYKNVFQIQSLYGGRNLFQYLFVGQNIVLVDSGIANTPADVIFPFLDRMGLPPQSLSLVVTTHPDLDHQGGNSSIKKTSPKTLIACGEEDRALVEDPLTLLRQRYNFAKAEHGVGFENDEPSPETGETVRIDQTFRGSEEIRLDDDWSLKVLHVPGHSHGHLALYDSTNRTAFVSDAIHGRGCPNADGTMGIPVTYYFVDAYLSTLQYLESLSIDVLFSGHWPTMRGEEIKDFICDSRRMVAFVDQVIQRSLRRCPEGLTLKELMYAVADAVGAWPPETWSLVAFPVSGHLERLERQAKVRKMKAVPFPRWQLV